MVGTTIRGTPAVSGLSVMLSISMLGDYVFFGSVLGMFFGSVLGLLMASPVIGAIAGRRIHWFRVLLGVVLGVLGTAGLALFGLVVLGQDDDTTTAGVWYALAVLSPPWLAWWGVMHFALRKPIGRRQNGPQPWEFDQLLGD